MQRLFIRLFLIGLLFIASQPTANADIIMAISFDESSLVGNRSIVEGTPTIDVYLLFDASDGLRGNDAGESFSGFTYAVGAENTGLFVPSFGKPVTVANLNNLLQTQNWSVVDQSAGAGPNQVGGNVNAPGGSGLSAPFGSTVLGLTLDTSGLADGDVVTLNPNLFNVAAVSKGLDDFGGNGNYVFNVGTLNVTAAVPEPSSLIAIGCFGCAALFRRKRSCKLSTMAQVMT